MPIAGAPHTLASSEMRPDFGQAGLVDWVPQASVSATAGRSAAAITVPAEQSPTASIADPQTNTLLLSQSVASKILKTKFNDALAWEKLNHFERNLFDKW